MIDWNPLETFTVGDWMLCVYVFGYLLDLVSSWKLFPNERASSVFTAFGWPITLFYMTPHLVQIMNKRLAPGIEARLPFMESPPSPRQRMRELVYEMQDAERSKKGDERLRFALEQFNRVVESDEGDEDDEKEKDVEEAVVVEETEKKGNVV